MMGTSDLVRLLTWLSPAFPTGAYAYSHGLEWAVEAGDVRDEAGLTRWLDAVLRHGAGRSDAVLMRHAHRCTDAGALLDLAELAAAVPARSTEERGPRLAAPEAALAGFLRKHGAAREDLVQDGDHWTLRRSAPAVEAAGLVAAALPPLLRRFPWPKSMRWGRGSHFTWVRPLRRILCLLDGRVVPFDLRDAADDGHGLEAGDATEGHRFHAPGAFSVGSFTAWHEGLRARRVIVAAGERRRRRHHRRRDLPAADVEDAQAFERQLHAPLEAHVGLGQRGERRHPDTGTDQVERGERRCVGLAERDLRLRVHQQHIGVAHQDGIDAAVAAIRLVREVDVLPDVEPGHRDVLVAEVERFRLGAQRGRTRVERAAIP